MPEDHPQSQFTEALVVQTPDSNPVHDGLIGKLGKAVVIANARADEMQAEDTEIVVEAMAVAAETIAASQVDAAARIGQAQLETQVTAINADLQVQAIKHEAMREIAQAATKTHGAVAEHKLQLQQEASQAVAAKTQQWAQAEERAARNELEL